MEELALGRQYASIYFAGPTFNLLPNNETAHRALQRIGKQLREGGLAMIPLWIPAPTAATELGVPREIDSDGVVLRYTPLSEKYDPRLRTRTTTTRYERVTSTGIERVDRRWIIHWHTPDGFRELCDRTGVTIVRLVDDDTGGDATDASAAFTATLQRA